MSGSPSDNQKMVRVSGWLINLSGLVALILPVIILVVVVIRAMAPQGIPLWSIDVCELLMWLLTYLGLGYVWRQGRHVTVEVFLKYLPARWRRLTDVALVVILLSMVLIMMVGGFQVWWDSWVGQKKTTNEFPEYYFSWAIPLGLSWLVLEMAGSLWKRIRGEPLVKSPHQG